MSEEGVSLKHWAQAQRPQTELLEEEAEEMVQRYGFGDESQCTYEDGAVQQYLWSCVTCAEREGREIVAVCFACSMTCHEDHRMFEVFEKKGVRCDCGTVELCQVQGLKELQPVNEGNHYQPAQNFKGVYCHCAKPYDPEKDDMLMCYSCTEWFHWDCLGMKEEEAPEHGRLVCGAHSGQEGEHRFCTCEECVKEEEREQARLAQPLEVEQPTLEDALASMPHTQGHAAVQGFLHFKESFRSFFNGEKRVYDKGDVATFFEQLNNKKRKK